MNKRGSECLGSMCNVFRCNEFAMALKVFCAHHTTAISQRHGMKWEMREAIALVDDEHEIKTQDEPSNHPVESVPKPDEVCLTSDTLIQDEIAAGILIDDFDECLTAYDPMKDIYMKKVGLQIIVNQQDDVILKLLCTDKCYCINWQYFADWEQKHKPNNTKTWTMTFMQAAAHYSEMGFQIQSLNFSKICECIWEVTNTEKADIWASFVCTAVYARRLLKKQQVHADQSCAVLACCVILSLKWLVDDVNTHIDVLESELHINFLECLEIRICTELDFDLFVPRGVFAATSFDICYNGALQRLMEENHKV